MTAPASEAQPPVGALLPHSFFARSTPDLARALLGLRLVRRWAHGGLSTGLIVEVEAYGGRDDLASHARSGPTRRNATMFGSPGHAYVYRVYGIHTCLNVVGAEAGAVGAVLVRAVMPETGEAELAARRATPGRSVPLPVRLAAGPGNVAAAYGIGLESDGLDLTAEGRLYLVAPTPAVREALLVAGVVSGPRVGVERAGPDSTRPWRFGVRGHPALSRAFPRGA
jgi:DNA-3-methyladenine glycosylase